MDIEGKELTDKAKKRISFGECMSANLNMMNKCVQINAQVAAKINDEVVKRFGDSNHDKLDDHALALDAISNLNDMTKDIVMMMGNITIMTAQMSNLINQRLPGGIVASVGDMSGVDDFLKGKQNG